VGTAINERMLINVIVPVRILSFITYLSSRKLIETHFEWLAKTSIL